MSSERRCPDCGALVAIDADWCGQCYASLKEPEAPTNGTPSETALGPSIVAAAPTELGEEVSQIAAATEPQETEPSETQPQEAGPEGAGPTWKCPVCERPNTMDLNICPACGTPFGRLFQEPEKPSEIPAKDAAAWSILLPGVGHLKAGRTMDGVARLVLLAWTVGTLAVLLVARFGKGGLGPTASLVYLFLIATALLYVESAVDAYRVAGGDPPLVSPRVLMWAVVILVLLSILLGSLVVLPAARGR
jgi:hypothetical protein